MGQEPDICSSVKDVIVCDSKGALHTGRDDLNEMKKNLLSFTNKGNLSGNLLEAIAGADVFVGDT